MTTQKNQLSTRYTKNLINFISEIDHNKINNIVEIIKKKSKKKKKIFVFGNGGSASTANHFAVDMTKNAKINVTSYSNDNHITCFSNDYGFENWIAKTLEHNVKKNDLVFFISFSGNSKNLVNGVKYCKKKKIQTFSLTGSNKDNKLNKFSDDFYWIRSKSYNQVEIMHHIILLLVVDLIIGRINYNNKL